MANDAMETGRISIRLQHHDWWKARPIESADRRNIVTLKKGFSQPAVSSNSKTRAGDWKKDGSTGTDHPPTKKKAIRNSILLLSHAWPMAIATRYGKYRNAMCAPGTGILN